MQILSIGNVITMCRFEVYIVNTLKILESCYFVNRGHYYELPMESVMLSQGYLSVMQWNLLGIFCLFAHTLTICYNNTMKGRSCQSRNSGFKNCSMWYQWLNLHFKKLQNAMEKYRKMTIIWSNSTHFLLIGTWLNHLRRGTSAII